MGRWHAVFTRFYGHQWKREDGVEIYRPTGRSWFRVQRRNCIGYGFEDLTGAKGTALTFKTAEAAKTRADLDWPMEEQTRDS